jgi:DNA-binding response OmpR family regulator
MRKKILVVEDDSELVELIRFNLKKAGFSVGTAHDGIEALKKVRSLLPDLILLDLMLPELDGFAVCEILRRDPKTSTVPIIILTAMSSQLARLTGLDAGASDYITKPFSPKLLLARVQALLDPCAGRPSRPSPDRHRLVTNSPLSVPAGHGIPGDRETEDPCR